MTQSRVCLVSLDPDLLGQELGWAVTQTLTASNAGCSRSV